MKRKLFIGLAMLTIACTASANLSCDTARYPSTRKPINKRLFKGSFIIHDSVKIQYMTVSEFKERLGRIESNNNYRMINQFGFKGKYATSDFMIKKLSKLSQPEFLKDSIEQERVMNESIALYLRFIKKYRLLKYLNKEIAGLTINLEMLLAGCHFSPDYLVFFLNSKGKKNETFGGITCRDFMKLFMEQYQPQLMPNSIHYNH